MSKLDEVLAAIGPLDEKATASARARQDTLTKPQGSLGRLEELSVQVAGITGQERPRFPHKVVVTMAGDHGVAAQGVSAYPADVTPQMVLNFLRGGAGINVLARHAGARVVVVDMGVAAELPSHPKLMNKKVRLGTADMSQGPAMSRAEALRSLEAGIEVVEQELARGLDLLATGDMGIGNTTASSAVAAVFTGKPVFAVTGRGTGLDDAGLQRKIAIIETALAVNRPDPQDPLDVLAKVGGLEIGGIAGAILAGAAHRRPVVIDGFISGAAALIAAALCPRAKDYMIAAHCSVERGHRLVLEHLGLKPLLDLNLRLGEGTGATLGMFLVEAAARVLDEMATFAEAGVSEAEPSPEPVEGKKLGD
ncbi:MAG: nicotinate-nucleotide--dimethylbenzimidazole phosphoribosyltransferase [Chloroflexota bacterium]|nr:nicotinate-nucleotide--dimethylbenzimidazole phosphoribosyltransferase [Chloroflexota bacterium]